MSQHLPFQKRVIPAVFIAVFTLAVGALGDAPEGFTPLFNGKDLSGWEGDARLWRVENGEIVGSTEGATIEHNQFLSTTETYSDFVLKAKVKLRNGNSGIQFRSERHPDNVVKGYQADIAEQTYFGMLYEEGKRGFMPYWSQLSAAEKEAIQSAVNKGDWNEYEITCQGDRITLVLNGHTTCNIRDPEGARSGVIALQLHTGDPMQVRFKDIYLKPLPAATQVAQAAPADQLMPDYDRTRREKLDVLGGRFRVPDGFSVEEVATDELIGSVINMTFDHLGRPIVAAERAGVRILVDEDGDGQFESQKSFSEDVSTAMGLHYIAPGDLLVQANGPDGPGMYRLTDTDGDDDADEIERIMLSNGGMGEHGPHAILTGPDGYFYVLYGNHAYPRGSIEPDSPSRLLQEDHLLPRYVDPRGHANSIRAPAGTVHRVSSDLEHWSQIAAGFRNAFDMAMNATGEIFTFDADMEWDFGLPWYRPIRVAHVVPGGDYGWRTGSSKMPFYYIDTLPSVDDVGRGSPVGVCFYEHDAYPEKFRGAFFMGDWTRGRIRVLFPATSGATYEGTAVDFVLGEPLNVTDLDVGPDGFLYFTTGGRGTHGGMYRVSYDGADRSASAPDWSRLSASEKVMWQNMPRSAWGKKALLDLKAEMGRSWKSELEKAAADEELPVPLRLRALEALQIHGPKPDLTFLRELLQSDDDRIVAQAVFLLGTFPFSDVRDDLAAMLAHADPVVQRRAAEALVRSGLEVGRRVKSDDKLVRGLLTALNSNDRFVRYSARLALLRVDPAAWSDTVLGGRNRETTMATFEQMVALIHTMRTATEADAVFDRLRRIEPSRLNEEQLLAYLRTVQLAFIRDVVEDDDRQDFKADVGSKLLGLFPTDDDRVNRELQILLAYMNPSGAIDALLTYLTPDKSQQEQIHTVYALRAIDEGWNASQREQLVAWFDRGREIRGAASMEGYIENLWQSTLALLPENEYKLAVERKEDYLRERRERTLALMAEVEGEEKERQARNDLAQMSYAELSNYLEFDPMSYRTPNLEQGKKVFIRARCVDCHVFGALGRGGGPDLSTVAKRFRRSDILEAIMYPSRVISDQYTALDVELRSGDWITGMLVNEDDDTLVLITALGERVDIPKERIAYRRESDVSIMPEGLLGMMSLGELVSLVQFLEHGADVGAGVGDAP